MVECWLRDADLHFDFLTGKIQFWFLFPRLKQQLIVPRAVFHCCGDIYVTQRHSPRCRSSILLHKARPLPLDLHDLRLALPGSPGRWRRCCCFRHYRLRLCNRWPDHACRYRFSGCHLHNLVWYDRCFHPQREAQQVDVDDRGSVCPYEQRLQSLRDRPPGFICSYICSLRLSYL
jgi:hypothetical protein